MQFDIQEDFDITWLSEKLRDDHGYLGPHDNVFYPTAYINKEDEATPSSTPSLSLFIEARRPGATPTPIDESDRADIQAIIDAHDGTPPAEIQAEQTVESNARTRAKEAIQTLENIHSNWDSLTNAQKNDAMKLNMIVTA